MEGTCRTCAQPVTATDAFCGNCGEPATPASQLTAPVPQADSVLEMGPWRPGKEPVAVGNPWPASITGAIPADAAMGQRTPNSTYLGQRLLYDKAPEAPFDPLINRSLMGQFLRHWLVYWLTYWVCAVAAGIVLGILSLGLGGIAFILWGIGGTLTAILFACLFWLIPVPALLSEWKFAIDGKGAAAPVTFEHISWALSQHQTPLDLIQVRRLKLDGDESRDYLEIRRGLFTGFIACFTYGQDLYVGWTFWVRLSPARWLLMSLARIWQTVMRRGDELHTTLRFDYARAMREAMHSVAREGVDVAVGRLHAGGEGTMAQIRVAVSELDT
jgi:hypothetical protein